jgi:hypothetical protein
MSILEKIDIFAKVGQFMPYDEFIEFEFDGKDVYIES